MRINKCFSCSLFVNCFANSLNKTELMKLEKHKIRKVFNNGEVIYTENKNADNLFTLIEGDVKLEHVDDLRTPVILRIAHGSEIIGLEAMMPRRKYLISATAETETLFLLFPVHLLTKPLLKIKPPVPYF